MDKKPPTRKAASVPSNMGSVEADDQLDFECEKIFHPEKFDFSKLNEAGGGNVDQGAQFYRTMSEDSGGVQSSGKPRFQTAASFSGAVTFSDTDAPVLGHNQEEFAHNHPIMTRLRPSGRKTSEPTMEIRKKNRKESDLGTIGEVNYANEDDDEPISQSLPWKLDNQEGPVLSQPGIRDEPVQDEFSSSERKVGGGVQFSVGGEDDDDDDDDKRQHRKTSHHKHRKTSHQSKMDQQSLDLRRTVGSDIALSQMGREATELDEAIGLKEGDLDDIGSHRFEKGSHVKHKISEKEMIHIGSHRFEKGSHVEHKISEKEMIHIGKDEKREMNEKHIMKKVYGYQETVDHTPHELFVEMDELQGDTWVEKSRWVKYEEDLEEGAARWGKPHVASLSFHSLINLRVCLENCALILDFDAKDFPGVVYRMVEELSVLGHIEEEQKSHILRVLLYRHKHVQSRGLRYGIKRSFSQKSLTGLLPDDRKNSMHDADAQLASLRGGGDAPKKKKESEHLVINMLAQSGMSLAETGLVASASSDSLHKKHGGHSLLHKMAEGTEGTTVLVGAMDDIKKPIVAMVRLSNAIMMPNTMEVSVPVRFIFILFTPKDRIDMDHYEIGRAYSTLMSNPGFHNMCYKMEEMRECLHALNMFLDDSIVLPPGDWDTKHLTPMTETFAKIRKRRKVQKGEEDTEDLVPVDDKKEGPPKRNPMERVSMPFGGLINDIKQRYPKYLSDIKDGLDPQVIAAALFIYFACLSGAIAFGGLLGEKTENNIGIPETIIVSAVAGLVFALFGGCPLIITGVTGPVLLFDDALYQFSKSNEIDFLPWRVWIGIWGFVIAVLVAGFQGSTLVKHFTRFTKDIFASLVALLFIFEAFKKLIKIFKKHPLHSYDEYCEVYDNRTILKEILMARDPPEELPIKDEPNTALMSAILMFGTFFLAYFLKMFRNSNYFGRNVRRALGDFGVPISIVIMVALDFAGGDALHTEKLKVPDGLQVSDATKRGWMINPFGGNKTLYENGTIVDDTEFFYPVPAWEIFAGILPAILLYLLLFMETHICELIMMDKTKDVKGAGLHLDIVLLCFVNMIGTFVGGPWICAATVRAVSHVSALTVMSTTHAPGDAPKVVGVKDQRVSASAVSILLGLSVLLSPVLKHVPFAVLFGVFLYMGQSGMNGVQFFDRLFITIKPQKYHPQVTYVKKVKTWRMNLFTFFQLIGLAILWAVKSIPAIALAFPFFVIAMIPYRLVLNYIFTKSELNALDGPDAGKEDCPDDEEDDFFNAAADMPAMIQALPFANTALNHLHSTTEKKPAKNGLPSSGATTVW